MIPQTLLRRVALWAVGQALPKEAALKRHTHALLKSITFSVITGILCVGLFAIIFSIVHMQLVDRGVDPIWSLITLSSLLGIGILVSISKAKKSIETLTDVKDELSIVNESIWTIEDCEEIVSAFLSGMAESKPVKSEDVAINKTAVEEECRDAFLKEEEAVKPTTH